jgi:hypothetical protein
MVATAFIESREERQQTGLMQAEKVILSGFPDQFLVQRKSDHFTISQAIMGTWLVPLGGFFFFATATYQLAVALLLLSKGKWVKFGLVGGILFFLGITPIMVMTFPSVIGAAGLAFLLTKEYNSTVLDMLRTKLHPGRAVA